jgi:hypothetical protein
MLILSKPLGFSMITYNGAQGTGSSLQTPPFDTTGADLLVVSGGASGPIMKGNLSDNKGNTWTKNAGIAGVNFGNTSIAMYYSRTTLVGPNHIFNWNNNYWGGILVAAFKGSIASPADMNSSKDGVTPVQTPGIMPSVNVALLVTACCADFSNIVSVDSGYTILFKFPGTTNIGQSMAYKFQTTAAVTAPTWVSSASGGKNGMTASTVSFKGQ